MSKRDPRTREVEAIVKAIHPALSGQPPEIQGAVLADLLATFIAGHHPALREEILTLHVDAVRTLIPHNELEIFARRGGKPEGWEPS
jgi:hypothetical protein